MRLAELVATSKAVAATSGRLDKIDRLAALLKRLSPDEVEVGVAFLSGSPLQGRIGVAGSVVAAARSTMPATEPTLDLEDVDAAFGRIAVTSGRGSAAAKAQHLRDLFGRATAGEQEFLIRLLFGELRQGALEGVLVEAVARAASLPAGQVRRAAMLAGALAPVARAALAEGDAALARFTLSRVPAGAADARRIGRGRRRGAGGSRRSLVRIQARWRADPGAQESATRSGSSRGICAT